MKGGTARSLPHTYAPWMAEAKKRGIQYNFNPKNYWSSLALMQVYVSEILAPYFLAKKVLLGVAPDGYCLLQLDVWSVHRSYDFRKWLYDSYPWIVLDFVPGGLTGLWQVCDVGIQKPFKQAIRQAQLEDMVSETMGYLKDGVEPTAIRLDTTIGTLRDRSPRW
jgi:hypothetical protein